MLDFMPGSFSLFGLIAVLICMKLCNHFELKRFKEMEKEMRAKGVGERKIAIIREHMLD
jgi:hypothetical protein